MARSQVTGASFLPPFPKTLEGERILREPATANGPTVPPRQYFGLTAMYPFERVASRVRSKSGQRMWPGTRFDLKWSLKDVRLALWQQKTTTALKATFCQPVTSPCKHSGKGRDSTPRVLCFEIAWLGKQARLSFFRSSRLMQPKIPAMLERDQAESVPHQ